MDITKQALVRLKIRQAVGSMAIEGIRVSRQGQATMLRVANGKLTGSSAREALIAKHRVTPA